MLAEKTAEIPKITKAILKNLPLQNQESVQVESEPEFSGITNYLCSNGYNATTTTRVHCTKKKKKKKKLK